MRKMRISSLNTHAYPRWDISEFIRQGLFFNKKVGFDGVFHFEVGGGKLSASMRATYAKYSVQAADELMAMIE
ncbi:MAG: hypothetical protein E7639_06140 [Ruminococcaceae bacterium]|nr:hypothetical protein [Oscillospiraceae bacterium]